MNQDFPQTQSPNQSQSNLPYIGILILILFLCSGMTGLLYEIIWSRLIIKVIGAAPFAISIVLTVFMGGLGLGSYLASRYIDQIKKPAQLLQLYGVLEIVIGIYAFILPSLINASQPIFSNLYNWSPGHFMFFNIFILIGAILLFIFPVTLMGATLPILIRFYVAKLGHLGSRVGQLYAINTLGAAVGSILSGFILINLWGVDGTLRFAVVLNGIIGGVSFVAASWIANRAETDPDYSVNAKPENLSPETPLKARNIAILIIFAVSGYCAMAYEVIWTRLLGLIIGPTTYSFSIVLTTFIVGLALGSAVFGHLADRSKHPFQLLIFTQFCAAVLALFVSQFMGNSQFIFAKLIHGALDDFAQLSIAKASILFLLMVGPTILLGATFPLVGKIYTSSIDTIGQSIGFAYAINTIGALLGSFSAGFLLIPLLGKENSLSLVIGLQMLTSFLIYGYFINKEEAKSSKKLPIIIALFGVIILLIYPRWDRQQLATGKYYRFGSVESLLRRTSWLDAIIKNPAELLPYSASSELVFYGDGVGGFTTVEEDIDALGKPNYTLYNSGKADASSESDMSTQTLLAHIPLLFHPNPQEAMILGLASGVTGGEALYYDLKRLDILEISEQVVNASKFFEPWNNQVLSHPAVNLIIQDGRAHLELTDQKYDVIISEPSNPWMAGLASLFTEDFFQLVKNRLNWDGIFVQWLPSYQMDWATFSMVGRTFSEVFPNSLLMKTFISGNDYLFIGFKGQDQLSIENALQNLPLLQKSPNLVVEDPRILYRLMVSDELQQLFGEGPIHTDDKPLLEFVAPKRMHLNDESVDRNIAAKRTLNFDIQDVIKETVDLEGQLNFAKFALSVFAPFEGMVDLSEASEEQYKQYSEMLLDYSRRKLIESFDIFDDEEIKTVAIKNQIGLLEENLSVVPDRTESYMFLTNAYASQDNFKEAIKYCKLVAEYEDDPIDAYLNLGLFHMRLGQNDEAIMTYNKALSIDPGSFRAHNNLGTLYERDDKLELARNEYELAISVNPDSPMAHYNLAGIYYDTGDLENALIACQKALEVDPDYVSAYSRLSDIYIEMSNPDEAFAALEKALKLYPDWELGQQKMIAFKARYSSKEVSKPVVTNVPKVENSDDPRYYYNRGVVAVQKQHYEAAVDDFKHAIKLKPDYLNAMIGLGATYQALENPRAAIEYYNDALKINPDHGGTHNNLAIVYSDIKNYELAIVHCDKAIALGFRVHESFLKNLARHR